MEVKNTMAIESIPIMLEDDDIGMELSVELLIDIPDMVAVGEADIDMLMPLMLALDMDIIAKS